MFNYIILILIFAVSFATTQEVDPQKQEVINFLSDGKGVYIIFSLFVLMMAVGTTLLMAEEFYLGIIIICGSIINLFVSDIFKHLAGMDVPSSHMKAVYISLGIILFSTIAKGAYMIRKNTLFFENSYNSLKKFFSNEFSKKDKVIENKSEKEKRKKTTKKTTKNQYHINKIEKTLELFQNNKYTNEKQYNLLKGKVEKIIDKVFEIEVKYEADRFELKEIVETHIPELIERYLSTLPKERNFNKLINSLNKLENFIEHVAENSFDDGSKFKAYKNFIDKKYKVEKNE